jgi:hypothetical protein
LPTLRCRALRSAGFIVFLLSVVVMTIASMSLRGHRFAYGEALDDSLLLNIRVTAYPPGRSAADLQVFESEPRGMQHSALCNSLALVRALAAWFDTVPRRTSATITAERKCSHDESSVRAASTQGQTQRETDRT